YLRDQWRIDVSAGGCGRHSDRMVNRERREAENFRRAGDCRLPGEPITPARLVPGVGLPVSFSNPADPIWRYAVAKVVTGRDHVATAVDAG
ncbi:MAG TPA: hypothetical protein VKX16_14495, partial [Chloroflexota bacterium]|nr:hypothetical protein [Chloroflexota bacterium]